MPLIQYQDFNFKNATMRVIDQAIEIIKEYSEQGYDLTLRQLYYQFVSRGYIENKDTEYKKLGSIVNDARLAGLIDWDSITDRTRPSRGNTHWEDPAEIFNAISKTFRIDTRATQPVYLEVWIEKDALVGVLERICRELDVPYFSCRGYVSQSSMWEAAQRFIGREEAGKETCLIHLGDHDPSGVDMSRDIQDRLTMFGSKCEVSRIALTMSQIEEYSPPPNPAKITDSRCNGYIENFGHESWELDALDPNVITGLIRKHVNRNTIISERDELIEQQNHHRKELAALSNNWTKVSKWIEKQKF